MSTTMTPFLYSTRTLLSISTRQRSSLIASQYRRIQWKETRCLYNRGYSTTHWAPNTPNSEPANRSKAGAPVGKGVGDAAGKDSDNLSRWKFNSRLGPAHNNGLLFRRVESGQDDPAQSVSYERKRQPQKKQSWDSEFARSDTVDFDEGIHRDMLHEQDDIADLTNLNEVRESTITDSERYAFQKIFADIFKRTQDTNSNRQDTVPNEVFNESEQQVDMETAKLRLDSILTDALSLQPRPREELEALVNRYPPALRAAAAKAVGLVDDVQGQEHRNTLDVDQLETLRSPERERVENLMRAATTDFELWEVMEKEVFSLIPKLGLEDTTKPVELVAVKRKKAPSKKRGPMAQATVEVASDLQSNQMSKDIHDYSTTTSSNNAIQEGISPLALYGPLYPAYVLLGLRLLDRSFAKPSPLTLSVLPKIKSMGLISQVLGASTQLYNELLRIHRFQFEDYRGVLNLLEEMEMSGLELDRETLSIVSSLHQTQLLVQNGRRGSSLQTVSLFPEFAPHKFQRWEGKIYAALGERA